MIPQRFAEVVRLLLEHGANDAAQDNDGLTPLDLASRDRWLAKMARSRMMLTQHVSGPGAH